MKDDSKSADQDRRHGHIMSHCYSACAKKMELP